MSLIFSDHGLRVPSSFAHATIDAHRDKIEHVTPEMFTAANPDWALGMPLAVPTT
ncbi:hypothetical protein AB0F44_23195 [Nocardioides sp. NPDC023903]|uniref:hypothetical protein n=1 Tax=Nocardioides sp. NPDC023903 TaxID=3157195 RepID=UPI0033D068BD